MISDEPWDINIQLTNVDCPYKSKRAPDVCNSPFQLETSLIQVICTSENCIWRINR